MRVVRVVEPSDLAALYRFRHQVYVDDLGWLSPHPSRLVQDRFDDFAYNYAALDDDGTIVGSVRVVPDGPAGLPLERVSPLNSYRSGKRLAELCRLVVHRSHQGSHLGGLLMKAGYQCCVSIAATHIALDTYLGTDESSAMYAKMGFVRVAGPYSDAFHLRDMPSVTLALDLARAYQEWPQQKPALFRFFTNTDARICHVPEVRPCE